MVGREWCYHGLYLEVKYKLNAIYGCWVEQRGELYKPIAPQPHSKVSLQNKREVNYYIPPNPFLNGLRLQCANERHLLEIQKMKKVKIIISGGNYSQIFCQVCDSQLLPSDSYEQLTLLPLTEIIGGSFPESSQFQHISSKL